MAFWEECQFSKAFIEDVKWLLGSADKLARAEAQRWEMAQHACSLLSLIYEVNRAGEAGNECTEVERDQTDQEIREGTNSIL